MAKRMTKTESKGLGLLIIAGLIIAGVGKVLEVTGLVPALIICVIAIGLLIWFKHNQMETRLAYLRDKYRDETTVQGIIQHHFWEGQTSEQLIDSLGNPVTIDLKVLKAKRREIWKYNQAGVNRYGLRITLEEGRVVGWDQKSVHG